MDSSAAIPPTDPAGADAAFPALASAVLRSSSAAEAARRVVDAVVADTSVRRCTLALWSRGGLRLVASSEGDLPSTPGDLHEHDQLRLGAMEEALAQGLVMAWPGEATAVRHELRLLQSAIGGGVACIPLGVGGRPLAAACLESTDGGLDAARLDALAHSLLAAALALRLLERAQRGLAAHARESAAEVCRMLLRPDHRARRRLVVVGALAGLAAVALPVERDAEGRARLEGRVQRVIPAPADGFVQTAWVHPGDHVKAGQPLVDLVDADLRLERERLLSQLDQRQNAYAEAMGHFDRVGASSSLAQIGETQAQLGLVESKLGRGRIVAPFDGLVLQGDLAQAAGAPLKQGDPLLTLAADGAGQRVVIEVDEIDIASVQVGQRGRVRVSSLAWESFPATVERITPVARAIEGRNVFEVDARIDDPRARLRPGLLGRASIAVGRAPLAWSWGRRLLAATRVAWWSWLA